MSVNNSSYASHGAAYPLAVSLTLIIAAIVLSFVDLMFLNDVIGKILDMGSAESMFIAFALGMVGIGVMAHQGVKVAYGGSKLWSAIGHYGLWVSLGVTFVIVRFFSASIMQLDGELGDEALLTVLGLNVREVDLVVAPLMLLLYFATGVMAKDGVKNLLLSPDFEEWKNGRKESKAKRKTEEEGRRTGAEARIQKARERAEKAQKDRLKEIEEAKQKAKGEAESAAMKAALSGNYDQALTQYKNKLNEIKDNYQKISSNIDFIDDIDKREAQFENRTKPSLMKIVEGSIYSTQNSVALAIRKKTGEDLAAMCTEIDLHNAKRR